MAKFSIYVKFPHIKVKMRFGFVFEKPSPASRFRRLTVWQFWSPGRACTQTPRCNSICNCCCAHAAQPCSSLKKMGGKKLHRFEHDIFIHFLQVILRLSSFRDPTKKMTKWIKKQYLCNNVYMGFFRNVFSQNRTFGTF